jgi:hypothetical protein
LPSLLNPSARTSQILWGRSSGRTLSRGGAVAEAQRIEAAMDRFAVLVLRGQAVNDDQQYAFSQHFEPMEQATGDVQQASQRRLHPGSGRMLLYLMALIEHATQKQFVYSHEWQPHDLVMWDNRAVMHRARRSSSTQVRELRRTTVADCCSTLEQAVSMASFELGRSRSGDALVDYVRTRTHDKTRYDRSVRAMLVAGVCLISNGRVHMTR